MNVNQTLRRPRILMLAFACSPEHGSEPGVGWNRAIQSAQYCDTWVICDKNRYQPLVEKYLSRYGPVPGLHFTYVARSRLTRFLWRIPGMGYAAYNRWHRDAYRVARRLHEEIRFDLTHQVNFCGYREPGYLWKLPVPFIWGPIGGTQNYPWRFLSEASWKGAIRETVRSVINLAQLKWGLRVRKAAKKASTVLAANTTIQRDLNRSLGVNSELLLETGISSIAEQPGGSTSQQLNILWVGDLNTWKALPLLLKALSQTPGNVDYRVRVLGRGPLEHSWKKIATKLGVAERITWMGWLPHQEALQQFDWADVLAFTSLRDTSGNVMLEALSQGVPVICLNHQGAADIVTDGCGIKIPVTTPSSVISGISQAIQQLWESPDKLLRLSINALNRAREYLWTRQGDKMLTVYQRAVGDGFLWSRR